MTDRRLKSVTKFSKILGKRGLPDLGFEIVVGSKITAQQAITLNKVEEELPSATDIGKSDGIELQEIMRRTMKSAENLLRQLKGESSKDFPMPELQGLDKQPKSI